MAYGSVDVYQGSQYPDVYTKPSVFLDHTILAFVTSVCVIGSLWVILYRNAKPSRISKSPEKEIHEVQSRLDINADLMRDMLYHKKDARSVMAPPSTMMTTTSINTNNGSILKNGMIDVLAFFKIDHTSCKNNSDRVNLIREKVLGLESDEISRRTKMARTNDTLKCVIHGLNILPEPQQVAYKVAEKMNIDQQIVLQAVNMYKQKYNTKGNVMAWNAVTVSFIEHFNMMNNVQSVFQHIESVR
ncbi:hypothetical protein TetV_532 [Tetraselmis virus 1]|uniref:Uncharacterized protein n=1 Tax=Tetraselmis virus 1 TaxID=2060617 RepID=A0A2P0VNY5_9VIRU|nr:hypothetical protein QJ968_gp522 [Tetraselmis virus 1]AUF82614.1 hypothetical protein TetV_532 [Tetraselmis virus 1]